MNIHETTLSRKNSFSFVSLSVAIVAICMGLFIFLFPSHREYFPVSVSQKDEDNDAGAKGEADFFFNARKNIIANAMDYNSMLAADIADRAMMNTRNTHAAMSTAVPNFNWMSMGPANVGGRTRAILIDNTDPTHQTIFAGGVSGGIWKSTNGGGTWDNAAAAISYSLNDTMSNINVSCITQDANGNIYIGTGEGFSLYSEGEGFSSAMLGGGVFKSTDDGATWNILPSTVPSATNNSGLTWAYTDRLATRPDNPQTVYAANNNGVYISRDGGITWRTTYYYNAQKKLTALTGSGFNALDLKISKDGSVIVCFVKSAGYYCYPQTSDSAFTLIKSTGAGHLPGGSRIEFAISPTDPNRIYASEIEGNGIFGAGATTSGIFMTMNAQTNGGYWHEIGPGGSQSFDPYGEPGGGGDQSDYDNTVGVPPANEAQVLCGGTTLWEWSGTSLTDTIGAWAQVSHYNGSATGNYDPLWIHPDEHAIVFDTKNPLTVYVGCDGGIFKCANWNVSSNHSIATGSAQAGAIAELAFQSMNRNYNVTQYYTVSFSPMLNKSRVAMSINNGTGIDSVTQYLGVGGGTQDNGSPYLDGVHFPHYPSDAQDMSGGDGAGSVVSALDPNVAYFCADYGSLERENNLSTLSSPTSAYTTTKGYNLGGNIDSVRNQAAASNPVQVCFVFPVALYENPYDIWNHDSLKFIASDSNYHVGNIIYPTSATANMMYPYKLTKAVKKGDTITVPDRVVSRLAIGFSGASGGIWLTGQAASTNVVIWMPIAGPLSTPDAYTSNAQVSDAVHTLAWTPDGNTLFAGTEYGNFYRFTNINSIIANNYKSGALWSNGGKRGIVDTTNQVVSKNLTTALNVAGRDILSISVDPADSNNVLVTLGNYGNTTYVYYSSNALAASPTFTSVQGNLPHMPVYGSILDIIDSEGHYITNSAMVATEHGIYTTSNINSASAKWVKNSNGLATNCLALAVKQQTAASWLCNNAGDIYVGTHGRGIWSARNSYNVNTAVQQVSAPAPALENLLIYPNPMTTRGNIEFNLSAADHVTIDIYDMQGRVVKTMDMGTQSPGAHTVTFESTGLSEGTYFAALTGTDFRKVSKFVVVK